MQQARPGSARVAGQFAGADRVGFLDVRAAVLALAGELADAIPPSDVLVAALGADGVEVLVLDLTRVPHCDGRGVDALAGLAGELERHGRELRLADPPPMVRMALYLDGRTAPLPVYDSVRAAALGDRDGLAQSNPPGGGL
jgi:anti-anti-sigma regulatory factor